MRRRTAWKRRLRRLVAHRGGPAALFLLGCLVGAIVTATSPWGGWGQRFTPRPTPHPATAPPQAYAWTELPPPAFPIPPYARFLKDVLIVLDPGHVGQRDPGGTRKRGPTGLREAEVNLRVALFLREFLEAAGARVVLTREVDRSLDLPDDEDLRQRVQVANELRADLFLSIHHNGVDNPQPNYTTVFYHASPEHSLAALCVARHLLTGLNDALRLETHLECAVLNDRTVARRNGFAVLRQARVPAVLSEASFHSNPQEETRLRDPVYNRREAYGLFLGLARWAQAGLPRVSLVRTADPPGPAGPEALIALDDGLSTRGGFGADLIRIPAESLIVRLNGQPARYQFDAEKRQLRVTLPKTPRGGRHNLFVDFQNIFGQHVLHPLLDVPPP